MAAMRGEPMTPAEDFRHKLCALRCVDGDTMARAGFCPDTIQRTMRDATLCFREQMTEGERAKFWPLVEQYLEMKRAAVRVIAESRLP
jgi:hypothetical protein